MLMKWKSWCIMSSCYMELPAQFFWLPTSHKWKALPTNKSEAEKVESKLDLKTAACLNMSKPAAPVIQKKTKSCHEEFSDVAQAEEATCQKEIKYNKSRIEASACVKGETAHTQCDVILVKVEFKK